MARAQIVSPTGVLDVRCECAVPTPILNAPTLNAMMKLQAED
jgi:hypothetical protein